jgi:adenylate cyclase
MDTTRPIWGDAGEAAPRDCLAACLITDAERYTGLTEGMEPGAVVELVNRYFSALFRPVLEHGGVVSDVKGDGLLAVWTYQSGGAEFKARACKACLEMIDRVEELNQQRPAYRLPTRLGLDFGPIALARVGAHERFEYRPVGDPVNTASRLEQLNKALKTRILVSDAFAQGVKGFMFRDVGSFQLRGKSRRIRVRELVGASDTCTAREHSLCREFADALAAYETGVPVEARQRLQALQAKHPEDGPTRYYFQRLELSRTEAEPARSAGWISQLWRAGGRERRPERKIA